MRRRLPALLLAALTVVATLGLATGTAVAATCTDKSAIQNRSYLITHLDGTTTTAYYLDNGSTTPTDVRPGDVIKVTFDIAAGCQAVPVGLASYRTKSATFRADEPQALFDSQSGTFNAGSGYTLTVKVPKTAADGSVCPNKHQDGPETKNKGANTSGSYDSTCDGRPSGNGNGGGNATGRPCAGCVGNADDKNPPGQAPDGSDANNGYECDGNKGVARENPAHTGCRPIFFQVDFFYGSVNQVVDGANMYGPRLIDAFNGPKG